MIFTLRFLFAKLEEEKMKYVRAISFALILCVALTGCGGKVEVTSTPANAPVIQTAVLTTTETTTTTTAVTTATTTTTETVTTTTAATKAAVKPSKAPTAVSVMKPSGAAAVSGSGVKLSVEYVSQIGFPTGCESASATMLLRFWGVDMDLATFVDSYLDRGAIRYTSGGTVAPHPNDAFVGDPRSTAAYGCYAPVIVRAIEKCLPDELQVVNATGSTLPELCKQYIDNGVPVMVWATIGMAPSRKGGSWTVETTGERYTWTAGEHCLLLVGYNQSNYYLLDPYQGRGLVSYPHATVEARYAELGYQAVGIQRIPTTTTTTTTTAAPTTTATTKVTMILTTSTTTTDLTTATTTTVPGEDLSTTEATTTTAAPATTTTVTTEEEIL